jgi:hypothetical protein
MLWMYDWPFFCIQQGVLFDTERRILETLQVTQLQIEALGAPTSQQVLSGSFVPKPAAGKQEAG